MRSHYPTHPAPIPHYPTCGDKIPIAPHTTRRSHITPIAKMSSPLPHTGPTLANCEITPHYPT